MSDFIQNKVKEFWLLWGIAPKGSLKYKKGKEIEGFLVKSLTLLKSLSSQNDTVTSKQIEDQLEEIIILVRAGTYTKYRAVDEIMALFSQQKQQLLDEVEEKVIGEDIDSTILNDTTNEFTTSGLIEWQNQLRAEQRGALSS